MSSAFPAGEVAAFGEIVGAELSELAIDELFNDLGITPTISSVGALAHYRAKDIDIFVGDIFDVSAEVLGLVDAVYDRAALVALPVNMRDQYTSHLMKIILSYSKGTFFKLVPLSK